MVLWMVGQWLLLWCGSLVYEPLKQAPGTQRPHVQEPLWQIFLAALFGLIDARRDS